MVIEDTKMSYTSKQMKSDLWDVYYKLQEAGASKAVKYAIILHRSDLTCHRGML